MMRMPLRWMVVVVCLCMTGCLVRYRGTEYQTQTSLGGYITGGVIGLSGLSITSRIAMSGMPAKEGGYLIGLSIAGAGLAVILATVIGDAIANADAKPLPPPPSPIFQPGEQVRLGGQSGKVSIQYVEHYYTDQGLPVISYNVCTYDGGVSICRDILEQDLINANDRRDSRTPPTVDGGDGGSEYIEDPEERCRAGQGQDCDEHEAEDGPSDPADKPSPDGTQGDKLGGGS